MTASPTANAYWASQIQAIQAACYVQPATTGEVATVIATATKYQCPFAIRGHGHSDIAGASNLANGIVLNLASFNTTVLSPDGTFATVGGGSQWGDVYTTLDPLNHTVIGGRETTVGVGGLTLGGGISYFSGLYGFTCDNVLSYETVLANGTVANISQSNAPDLYRALRGGGNNFGVVTRFNLDAYEYNLMQGGLHTWVDSNATQTNQIAAFVNFAKTASATTPAGALFISLALVEAAYVWLDGLYNAYASPPLASLPAYQPFFNQQLNSSQLINTQRTAKYSSFATELGDGQPSGEREQFHTGTYIADVDLLNTIFNIYREVVAKTQVKLLPVIGGANPLEIFTPALAFQPLTKNILARQSRRGGNVLGLTNPDTPRMLMSMSWPWNMPQNDGVFIGAMQEIVTRADQAAAKMGLLDDYIYMNYAASGEQVVESYGASNVQFMREVSEKYDPQSVFQTLVPGGFKLPAQ